MERIYDWLMHNVEDQGNHLTILNMERQTSDNRTVLLDVMARTKDIQVVNLLITATDGSRPEQPEPLNGRQPASRYVFRSEDDVIAYLADGSTTRSTDEASASGIQVLVFEPADDTDQFVFPPRAVD